MNCKECQNSLNEYLDKKLDDTAYLQVTKHLTDCHACGRQYALVTIAENVINEEKQIPSNPFLATRVMAEIKNQQVRVKIPVYQRTLQPLFIAASLTIAIAFGVLAGNMYKPVASQQNVPEELVYINDATLESLAVYDNQ